MIDGSENPLKEEIYLLADALFDRRITDEEVARLDRLVVDDQTARGIYVRYVYDSLNLSSAAGWHPPAPLLDEVPANTSDTESSERRAVPPRPSEQRSGEGRRAKGHTVDPRPRASIRDPRRSSAREETSFLNTALGYVRKSPPVIAILAAAVIVALAGLLIFSDFEQAPEPRGEAPLVAHLVQTANVIWEGEAPAEPGTGKHNVELRAGQRLDLKSGLAKIVYTSGVVVILEGPAQFEVRGEKRCGLLLGSLSALVEEVQAKEFVVETPTFTVTDLGTQFSVFVLNDGNGSVNVTDGAVNLETTAPDGAEVMRQLSAGEAVAVASGRVSDLENPPAGPKIERRVQVLAHWTFDDLLMSEALSEGMRVADHSPYGRHAFVAGGKDVPRIVDGAPAFGGGSALQFGSGPDVAVFRPRFEKFSGGDDAKAGSRLDFVALASFTIEAVIRTRQTDIGAIVAKDWAPKKPSWWFRVEKGRLRFLVCDGERDAHLFSDRTVNDNAWHHVAAVRDAERRELRLYIDGVLSGTVSDNTIGSSANDRDIRIGQFNNGNRRFVGNVDFVRIASGALAPNDFVQPGSAEAVIGGKP